MRRKAVFVRAGILCLIAGCLALLPISAHADLELRLSSDKSTYIQDEPLFHARVTVRNAGSEEAKVLKLLEPRFGFIRFEIEYPGGETLPYEPQAQASIIPLSAHWIPIPSGGEYSARIDISKHAVEPGRTCNTLYRPGEYRLRAYLDAAASKDDSNSRLKLVSNDLRITVLEPQGIDREAHRILTEDLRDGRMWTSLDSDGRDKYYKRVIAEYPDSRYAPYAKYWLALYDARIGTPELGSREVATLQKSCERFELLADEAGNTPLGLSLLRCAIRARAILGEADKARSLLDRALAMPFLSFACREILKGYHSAIDARWGHRISPGAGNDAAAAADTGSHSPELELVLAIEMPEAVFDRQIVWEHVKRLLNRAKNEAIEDDLVRQMRMTLSDDTSNLSDKPEVPTVIIGSAFESISADTLSWFEATIPAGTVLEQLEKIAELGDYECLINGEWVNLVPKGKKADPEYVMNLRIPGEFVIKDRDTALAADKRLREWMKANSISVVDLVNSKSISSWSGESAPVPAKRLSLDVRVPITLNSPSLREYLNVYHQFIGDTSYTLEISTAPAAEDSKRRTTLLRRT